MMDVMVGFLSCKFIIHDSFVRRAVSPSFSRRHFLSAVEAYDAVENRGYRLNVLKACLS